MYIHLVFMNHEQTDGKGGGDEKRREPFLYISRVSSNSVNIGEGWIGRLYFPSMNFNVEAKLKCMSAICTIYILSQKILRISKLIEDASDVPRLN